MCTDQGESAGAKGQKRTISMLFRALGPGLVIVQGVRCTTGDCRPHQATGPLHSLWRARPLLAMSFLNCDSGLLRISTVISLGKNPLLVSTL
jgi:hypothetical protein